MLSSDGNGPDLFKSVDVGTSVYTAKIVDRVCISNDGDKQVTQLTFELGRSVDRERLDVGQSIAVLPENPTEDVLKIIEHFGWEKD